MPSDLREDQDEKQKLYPFRRTSPDRARPVAGRRGGAGPWRQRRSPRSDRDQRRRGNVLQVFTAQRDGSLAIKETISTRGPGLGAGLGSQGAIAYDEDLLAAVNAGDNAVSLFSVEGDRLRS